MDSPHNFKDLIQTIRDELIECLKVFGKGDHESLFTCTSDLKRIWGDEHLCTLFDLALPEVKLNATQIAHLRKTALPLLSFAVYDKISNWSSFLNRLLDKASQDDGQSDPVLPSKKSSLRELKANLEDLLGVKIDRNDAKKYYYFVSPIPLRLTNDAEGPTKLYGQCVPIETREDPMAESGSYGLVYFGRIHPENVQAYPYDQRQAFKPEKPYAVAVKVFKRETQDAMHEVENLKCLKKFASNPDGRYPISIHHTIVKHYTHSEDLSPTLMAIFPFAELGSLWQLLNEDSAVGDVDGSFQELEFAQRFPDFVPPLHNPQASAVISGKDLRIKLLEQCLALAGALRFLHSRIDHQNMVYLFAHMDLKPNNIIISSRHAHPLGIWKLTDFGISVIRKIPLESHHEPDDSGKRQAPATIGTTAQRRGNTYQAPEVTISWGSEMCKDSPVRVGRKSDIWSFATIMTEVLAFAVGRKREFHKFQEQRRGPSGGDCRHRDDWFWNWRPDARGTSHKTGNPAREDDIASRTQVRPSVSDWLLKVEADNPDCASWVRCIQAGLKVNPHERPSAEVLFRLVQEVLYPPEKQASALRDELDSYENPDDGLQDSDLKLDELSPDNNPDADLMRSPTLASEGTGPRSIDLSSSRPSITGQQPARSGNSQYSSGASARTLSITPSSFSPLSGYPRRHGPIEFPTVSSPRFVSTTRSRIVYLIDCHIEVFDIRPEPSAPLDTLLQSPCSLRLPEEDADKEWKGMVAAGEYVVLYGYEQCKSKGMLRRSRTGPKSAVIRILWFGSDKAGKAQTIEGSWIPLGHLPSQSITKFDYDKRVAISPDGFIALIDGPGKELLILDAKFPDRNAIAIRHGRTTEDRIQPRPASQNATRHGPELVFQDVSFGEDGSVLYAAGIAGGLYTLIVYDLAEPEFPQKARATYKLNEISLKYFQPGTLLFPHSPELGCTVATDKFLRILGCLLDMSGGTGGLQDLGSSPFKPQPESLAVYSGRQLLTVDRKGVLAEYQLLAAPGSGGRPMTQLGSRKQICTFKKPPQPRSQLRAYKYSSVGVILVLLYHIGGGVEVLRILCLPD